MLINTQHLSPASARLNTLFRELFMTDSSPIRILDSQILANDWGVLTKYTLDYQRRDGSRQQHTRETYDRGNGATVLLYNLERRTIVLIRQFRLPTYLNGIPDGMLIETPAGLLDNAAPEERIRAEIEEETGYHLHHVTKLFEAYMSPGSVTEKLYFFAAEYDSDTHRSEGGGLADEGEDIEVMVFGFDELLDMIRAGRILDAKTIMLVHYAALYLFPKR